MQQRLFAKGVDVDLECAVRFAREAEPLYNSTRWKDDSPFAKTQYLILPLLPLSA